MESSQTKTIRVVVNGHERDAPAGGNILDLLRFLEIEPERVAVELDRVIVRKADWEHTHIKEGAKIEVVWFVGGG